MIWGIIGFVALIAVNGLFVAAEFALISARKDRLQTLADQGSRAAQEVIAIGGRLPALITGAQLGVTLASLALGWIAEPMFAAALGKVAELAHAPAVLAHPVALVLSLALVASVHVLFGEMVPKNLALSGPERAAMLLSGLLVAWVRITAPVTWAFQKTASAIVRLLGVEPKEEFDSAVSVAELGAMISESRKVGLLDEEEHRRLTRLLSIGDRALAEVAIPLEQVVSLPARLAANGSVAGPTAAQIEAAVARTGFSRFPVRHPAPDQQSRPPVTAEPGTIRQSPATRPGGAGSGGFLGYVHLKDALALMTSDARGADELGPQLRPLPQVSAALNLDDALAAMMAESTQLALVVGEEGAVVGLASLEDLVRGLMDGPKNPLGRSD
ncbi:MAG: hemolysin family protein [Segniliparus sp.]|uniref:hemolysin family protein n=1 Tax=Segniliparus sp. TaxID=2804064 RepID=UPI003F30C658